MTRRKAFQVLLSLLAWVGILPFPARRGPSEAAPVAPHPDRSVPAAALSDAALETLLAFGEVLVEGRSLSRAERRHLIEHITMRARSDPGILLVYLTAAELLDRLAGAGFGTLDVHRRTDLGYATFPGRCGNFVRYTRPDR